MARIIPDGWRETGATGAARREIDTLALLERGLPDHYTVYHAVHFTNVEQGYSIYGDIDFAVVGPHGQVLLIEQVSGFLDETGDGLHKKTSGRPRNVAVHIGQSVQKLQARLLKRLGQEEVRVEYLLYCPDYTVRQPEAAGVAPERVIDSTRRDQLVSIVETTTNAASPADEPQQVHRFLRDIIQLQPDTGALIGQTRRAVTRIAGGLAHWARQLEFEPFRLHVIGTAGSGKTQLALAEYRAALLRGQRPLYVCFNRPLADHVGAIAPEGGLVCTFHSLCEQVLRAAGTTPDFNQRDAFTAVIDAAGRLPVPDALRFDTVVVDEGQDFSAAWRDQVMRHATPDARITWLEDPMQNLYDMPTVPLPGWVTLHAHTNYRSPRNIVRMLQELVPEDQRIDARGPVASADIDVLVYGDQDSLIEHTKKAVSHCLASGFKREDIAIVSFRGRENSVLLNLDHLGPHPLRGFTGSYDLFGQAEYSEGEVLIESVYRFKGQSAPAIVFTEIDFATLDERTRRKLFVGATRAMLKLVLVMSRRAHEQWKTPAMEPQA